MVNSHSEKPNKFQIKERTFKYSLDVIRLLKNNKNNDYIIQTISKQLIRSATSIGANIIEAQAASSKKEFAKYYRIALMSANESIYWLELLKRSVSLNADTVDELIEETKIVCKILAKSLITMKGR